MEGGLCEQETLRFESPQGSSKVVHAISWHAPPQVRFEEMRCPEFSRRWSFRTRTAESGVGGLKLAGALGPSRGDSFGDRRASGDDGAARRPRRAGADVTPSPKTSRLAPADLVRGPVWDDFATIVEARLRRFAEGRYDFSLSEETFRLDFAVVLARRFDYAHRVFPEFPCDLEPSQKLDLFLDEPPGWCFEFKFFRSIPSQRNPPLTQHLGSVWTDLFKLSVLCQSSRLRFLVVFADERFRAYLTNHAALPQEQGETLDLSFERDAVPKTLRDTVDKRLSHVPIPDNLRLTLTNLRTLRSDPFHGYLIRVS